jgi:hypothetical protein
MEKIDEKTREKKVNQPREKSVNYVIIFLGSINNLEKEQI